ncbi:MAG TPA: 50S ribosomal protein L11 methyltransferase [Steroidobacteraceae bacterium]|nr:50S ribosomal protein L11 methyltransferase [Steroidobacteraceae bacterium]
MTAYLELSFELGSLDPQVAEDSGFACGACAVTFVDARDDPVYHPTKSGLTLEASSPPLDKTPDFAGTPVLEPAPGEFRLWPQTRVKCLFASGRPHAELASALAASLGIDAALIEAQQVADRAWEREWLKDFHAMRFGRRLWVCPRHERVSTPGAVVVRLDPGLAFGTGTHPSTALCLDWLDGHLAPGARVIDYGCGSGVLAIAAARLGAAEVHGFDIDPQALIATRDNARVNGVEERMRVHADPATLPAQADVLLANILARPLCELAARFAALLRPHGQVVLAGLMEAEAADVTGAYAACFDVARAGDRDGWVCLAGRRH